jgi:hypothetical protein
LIKLPEKNQKDSVRAPIIANGEVPIGIKKKETQKRIYRNLSDEKWNFIGLYRSKTKRDILKSIVSAV